MLIRCLYYEGLYWKNDGGKFQVLIEFMNALAVQTTHKSSSVPKAVLLRAINPSQVATDKSLDKLTVHGSEALFGDHFKKPSNPNAFDRFWGLNE